MTIQNPREILGGGIFVHDYFVAFSCKGRCVFGCCRCQSGCVISCSVAGRCSTWCCAIEAYAVTQAQATLRRRILRASADTSPQAALTTAARMALRRVSARCRCTQGQPLCSDAASPNRTEWAMGRPNHGKTTVQMPQMPVPSRPGRRLSATHASVGLPTGFQRPFEIPMRNHLAHADSVLDSVSHALVEVRRWCVGCQDLKIHLHASHAFKSCLRFCDERASNVQSSMREASGYAVNPASMARIAGHHRTNNLVSIECH